MLNQRAFTSKKLFKRRKKKQDACSAVGHVKAEVVAKVYRAALDVHFELRGVPLMGKLTGSFHKPGGG